MPLSKLLTIKEIPDCADVPRIGVIPPHHLFPIFSSIPSDVPLWIHSDGSAFGLFEVHDFQISDVHLFMDLLKPGMSFQLYKLHSDGLQRLFLAVTHAIDYEYLNLSFRESLRRFFLGVSDLERRLSNDTVIAASAISCYASDRVRVVGFKENALISFLVEYTLVGGLPKPKSEVKSNISALLTGSKRFSLVSSINNIDWVPYAPSLLASHSYLMCLTCVRPSEIQANAITAAANSNRSLLTSLAPKVPFNDPRVDTIVIKRSSYSSVPTSLRERAVYFLDASFLLASTISLEDLNSKSIALQESFSSHGIVMFQHGVSARAQFVSLFPGNAVYGEHFHTVYNGFVHTFAKNVLSL